MPTPLVSCPVGVEEWTPLVSGVCCTKLVSRISLTQEASVNIVTSREATTELDVTSKVGSFWEASTETDVTLVHAADFEKVLNHQANSSVTLNHEVTVAGGYPVTDRIREVFPVSAAIEVAHEITLTHTPNTGSEVVYLNGLGLTPGLGFDYIVTDATIHFVPGSIFEDDLIVVIYTT